MENKQDKIQTWQTKSHEALLKLLNNIGIIGAILAAVADIVFVTIMVVGVDIKADMKSVIIFAVVNALIGVLISVLLRYQGQKYAEVENEELCKVFYNKRAKEKKYLSMGVWMGLKTLQDVLIKGCTTAFSIFGMIYITIQGSKNPIQLLITLATLILFACFGLIGMNSAYMRFYNIQVPHMQVEIERREKEALAKVQEEVNKPVKRQYKKRAKKNDTGIIENSGNNIGDMCGISSSTTIPDGPDGQQEKIGE